MQLTSDVFKILGVPTGSQAFVSTFIRNKMGVIDKSLALATRIHDIWIGHNSHRVIVSNFRMTRVRCAFIPLYSFCGRDDAVARLRRAEERVV